MRESTLAAIGELAGREGAPAIEAALATARCLDENLDAAELTARLDRLAERFQSPEGVATPWQFLRDEGFGDGGRVDALSGSHIGRVLDSRAGLPITLGTLLIHVATRAGRVAHGVNFPGHFLVRVDAALVDPFSMVERSEGECLALLPAGGRPTEPFAPADTRAILLRMLNNVKYHHVRTGELHRALDIVECQLTVLPEAATLHLERGEYWYRLGGIVAARGAFAEAVRLADPGEVEVRRVALARLEALDGREDTRH